MHVLQICAVLLSFVSLLFLLISLSSNNWVELTVAKPLYLTNFGLWKGCIYVLCDAIPSLSSSFAATRAFMLLGMIASAVSSSGLCYTFRKSHIGSISLAMVSAIASLVAGICTMIAMSVFTADSALGVNGVSIWYGWSFGLGWACFPFCLLSGAVAFALQQNALQTVTTE